VNDLHSKTFPFSSADRWVHCTGSPKMVKDEPDDDSEVSREGTAAHWVGQQMLEMFQLGVDGLSHGEQLVGVKAPNGMIVTDEMFDGALTYYNIVTKTVGKDHINLRTEIRVKAHQTLDPEAWGTADALWYDVPTNTLYIWDFKFGHLSVQAFENWQLIGYAIAACETFSLKNVNPRCSLNIVQPRCYDGQGPLRNWVVAYDSLRAQTNIMKAAITDYRMRKTMLTSGRWCRECEGRYKCPALLQAAAAAIDFSTTTIPINMTNEGLAYELGIIERAEARIKQRKAAISAEAEARVRAGQLVPGRRMEDTMGHRKWSKSMVEITMLGETFGCDFRKEPELISPAAAESLLKKKKIDGAVISNYHRSTKTGVKLVADDGSRARQLFSQEKI